MPTSNRRATLLGLSLIMACFGNPETLGLPCTEDSACFDGLVCGPNDVCVEPSAASMGSGDGDGDTGDGDTGDGDPDDGDPETGEHDGESGDGDGDGDGESGDGDGEPGDGDGDGESGDGDGETGDPFCGNGIREGTENCDGMDLGGMSCADQGFGGGTISCNDRCHLVLSECCLVEGQNCQFLAGSCCGNMTCTLIINTCG
jgi:hypothetical protein